MRTHDVNNWSRMAAAVLTAALSATSGADTITETSDVGPMPASALWTEGNAALTLIAGWIESAADADTFAIYINDPAAFSANTTGSAVFDTQLFLFDQNGFGIAANDDIRNGSDGYDPRSALPVHSIPGLVTPGIYYLAISSWDYDPHSDAGAIFTDDAAYNAVVFNNGPGGAAPVSGWDGNGGLNGALGAYQIALSGATLIPSVPEPGAIALISIGVIGCCARRLSVLDSSAAG